MRDAFARIVEANREKDRQALLDSLTPEVRAEVESLLAALESGHRMPLLRDEDEALGVGSVVGPYLLVEELGRGGMGVVFRAQRQDGEFLREVAIKIAGPGIFGEAERRFIRERQILARLEHPHIVRLLDGGVIRGQRYVVMELLRGVPITGHARLLPLPERLRLLLQVCGAVQYAHQRQVAHRDLKPGNILVTADGTVKVLDFGIAGPIPEAGGAGASPADTTANVLSLSCASPEQLRGQPATKSSDIYALGVLMYELATGVNPQGGEGATFSQVYERVALRGEAPPPPGRRAGLASEAGRGLDAICAKAMAHKPEERYASVSDLAADIERYLAGEPVRAAPVAAWMLSRRSRRRLLAAVAALGAAAVLHRWNRTDGAEALARAAMLEARKGTQAGYAEARRLLDQAEARSPGLPLSKAVTAELGARAGVRAFQPWLRLAQEAVAQDPQCWDCQAILGFIHFTRFWNWRDAGEHLAIAARAPQAPVVTRIWFAQLLGVLRRFEPAHREIDLAIRNEPTLPGAVTMKGVLLYLEGKYEQALAQLDAAEAIDKSNPNPYYWQARARWALGQPANAMTQYTRFLARAFVFPKGWEEQERKARLELLHWRGPQAVVEQLLHETTEIEARRQNRYERAAWQMYAGRHREALDELEAAEATRPFNLIYIAAHPVFSPLRGEARFRAILERLKLSP